MRFGGLVLLALAAHACGLGNSPLAPTSNGCTSSWTGGGWGPPVSGLTLSAEGAVSRYFLSLRDIKVGGTTEFSVVLDPPRVEYRCNPQAFSKFVYLKWEWNSIPSGPPSYGPVAVSIASCQCSLFGEPAWKNKTSNVVNAHWEQRAWLAAPQTLTFRVRGTEVGSTRVNVVAYIDPPTADIDSGRGAFATVEIRVVR